MGIHYQVYDSLKLSAISGIDRQRKIMNKRHVRASTHIYIYIYIYVSSALSDPFDMVEI